jgi:hypothetical protein
MKHAGKQKPTGVIIMQSQKITIEIFGKEFEANVYYKIMADGIHLTDIEVYNDFGTRCRLENLIRLDPDYILEAMKK